jgi:acetyl-CoA C-acetyltransferase
MSRAPLLLNDKMTNWLAGMWSAKTITAKLKQIARLRPGHLVPVISLLKGLTDPVVNLSMGQTAENLAYRFHITRTAMDAFSLESHKRTAAAQHNNRLLTEITPLFSAAGEYFTADDGVRQDSSIEKLTTLKPFFDRKFGNVTPGNSSQVTDGAAILLLASREAVQQYQLPVLAKIAGTAWAGVDPSEMGLGPVYAAAQLMQRYNLRREDVDYWEINEAFAAQVLACLAAWESEEYCRTDVGLKQALGKIDLARLNVDGGAIALGHPVGASGARIVLHLAHILKREGARRGIATICIGGGQGGAMLIENTSGVSE